MERFISKYIGTRDKRLGHRKGKIIAFDVDGTLIDENDRPIYQNIDLLLWYVDRGYLVIVWSGGGIDWANLIVRKLGLEDIVQVEHKGSMYVDIAYDDEAVEFGEVNIEV